MYLALISEQTYGIPHHITNLSKQTEGLRDVNTFIENTNTFHTGKKENENGTFFTSTEHERKTVSSTVCPGYVNREPLTTHLIMT